MNEHEKLKQICDTIGYEYKNRYYFWDKYLIEEEFIDGFWLNNRNVNVREIIFTNEFMGKFNMYLLHNQLQWPMAKKFSKLAQIQCFMFDNLDNSVNYLYNLLFEWK